MKKITNILSEIQRLQIFIPIIKYATEGGGGRPPLPSFGN